ncbi:MAG: hypothetical protein HY740_00930 [Chloroflexi bacterium]|nr:hypothetical protein [Chloroflexota bacterium]MBI5350633.1 hypothetical protein [Chloroflexota bacterium]
MVFEDVIESAAEKLSGDERLRSNLTDDEFNPILDWAITRLEKKTAKAKDKAAAQKIAAKELNQIESAMKVINDLLKEGNTPTLESAAKPLKVKPPKPKIGIRNRDMFIGEVLKLIEGEWEKKK